MLDAKRMGEEVWTMCELLQSFLQNISPWELKICWSPKFGGLLPLPATSTAGSQGKLQSISIGTNLIIFPLFLCIPSDPVKTKMKAAGKPLGEKARWGRGTAAEVFHLCVKGLCYTIQNYRSLIQNRSIIFFPLPSSEVQKSHFLVQNVGLKAEFEYFSDLQMFKALYHQGNFLVLWHSISFQPLHLNLFHPITASVMSLEIIWHLHRSSSVT